MFPQHDKSPEWGEWNKVSFLKPMSIHYQEKCRWGMNVALWHPVTLTSIILQRYIRLPANSRSRGVNLIARSLEIHTTLCLKVKLHQFDLCHWSVCFKTADLQGLGQKGISSSTCCIAVKPVYLLGGGRAWPCSVTDGYPLHILLPQIDGYSHDFCPALTENSELDGDCMREHLS